MGKETTQVCVLCPFQAGSTPDSSASQDPNPSPPSDSHSREKGLLFLDPGSATAF